MTKVLLIKILPFLLPVLFLILWYAYQKNIKKVKPNFNQMPIKTMFLIFIIVFFTGIIYFRFVSQIEIDGKYFPPYLKDGNVVPGQFINE